MGKEKPYHGSKGSSGFSRIEQENAFTAKDAKGAEKNARRSLPQICADARGSWNYRGMAKPLTTEDTKEHRGEPGSLKEINLTVD